jgi:hypothetical protein
MSRSAGAADEVARPPGAVEVVGQMIVVLVIIAGAVASAPIVGTILG